MFFITISLFLPEGKSDGLQYLTELYLTSIPITFLQTSSFSNSYKPNFVFQDTLPYQIV